IPLELPSHEDLVEVEEILLIQLPREYKYFLQELGDVIYGSIEPCTASDPSLHSYLPDVASQAWDIGLPRHLIPICDKQGDFYAMDPDGEIQLWENGELADEIWDSIWHWAKEVWLES
ncbi:MAG: SMI1/KNR4 family protein, partial [Porticoccaceae bacterium]|nr:SMI1/KNR4 family protein [Porticoccaceae bacterium]